MNRSVRVFIVGLLWVALSGHGFGPCGCSKCDNDVSKSMLKSKFIDSTVTGLNYISTHPEGREVKSGKTFVGGQFYYYRNGKTHFSIGSIYLGEYQHLEEVRFLTPLLLIPEANDQVVYPKVVNMIRLLQSLDEDADPENGIVIDESVDVLSHNYEIDFSLPVLEFESDISVVSFLEESVGITELIESDKAITHFQATLESLRQ